MIFLQVKPIKTFDEALDLLQMAVELEFSTLPSYLYALYSIKPGTNGEASRSRPAASAEAWPRL